MIDKQTRIIDKQFKQRKYFKALQDLFCNDYFQNNIQLTSVISNTPYLELSLSQTFSLVPKALPGTVVIIRWVSQIPLSRPFSFHPFKYWKNTFENFDQMFFLLFQDNNMSVKRKLNFKNLGEKFQVWKTWKVVHLTKR